MTRTEDELAILQVHRDWWESCRGSDIPRMASCFPAGPNYLMFNLNTHPYFGIAEKVRLWEHYKGQLEKPEFADVRIMRMEISGDMAWIAAEGLFPERQVGPEGRGSSQHPIDTTKPLDYIRVRATELYQRDDGAGHPSWRIWHLHASLLCPDDEPRPGFGDTSRERGIGGNPWGRPLRVAGVSAAEGARSARNRSGKQVAIAAEVTVRAQDVQAFSGRLQLSDPPVRSGVS